LAESEHEFDDALKRIGDVDLTIVQPQRSFRNFCAGAKISTVHSRLLMNHAIRADVHQSYMTPGSMFDQLREASEAVSTYIMRHVPKGAERQLTRRLRDQLAQC
jgi:hypothetical protein